MHLRVALLGLAGLASATPLTIPKWTDEWLNVTSLVQPEGQLPSLDLASTLLSTILDSLSISQGPSQPQPKLSAPNTTTPAGCSQSNAAIRTEFRNMSRADRRAFTNSIVCLQQTPPQQLRAADREKCPGVKSRFDEYVATHINYTYNIHMTASFFAWHRFFIHRWEQDLRYHCNYTGTLPYWDWQLDADAPQDSELFNGDPYSMGSNGAYVGNRSNTWLALQDVTFPPGTGGGCVTHGPFANYTVNLGPLDSPYGNNVKSPFDHNPRCLVRDLNPWFSRRYNTFNNVSDLLLKYNTIQDFQARMQGYYNKEDRFGVHGGGHWLGGGNATLADFHASPADPVFYLHHAMIDRLWFIWQNLDLTDRQTAIYGTSTLDNNPPTKVMTLNDTVPFGLVAPDQRLGDLMSTFAKPFCYRYA